MIAQNLASAKLLQDMVWSWLYAKLQADILKATRLNAGTLELKNGSLSLPSHFTETVQYRVLSSLA